MSLNMSSIFSNKHVMYLALCILAYLIGYYKATSKSTSTSSITTTNPATASSASTHRSKPKILLTPTHNTHHLDHDLVSPPAPSRESAPLPAAEYAPRPPREYFEKKYVKSTMTAIRNMEGMEWHDRRNRLGELVHWALLEYGQKLADEAAIAKASENEKVLVGRYSMESEADAEDVKGENGEEGGEE